jgi:DNA repair photolyase
VNLRPVDNPPNPYLSTHAEWLEPPPEARLEVYHETARSILSRNDSPDLPFTWSINPYRGCQHACIYCYARCSHEYLGHGAGTDFETKLVVKVNAAELLDKAFRRRSWTGESVHFSGVTDCYQPLEASYRITRACLEVCARHANPACIVTKGALVARDVDVLAELRDRASVSVVFSLPTVDHETARIIEPQAASPQRRLHAMRVLAEAGIRVSLLVSPVIPGLTDTHIPQVLEAAAEAGTRAASFTGLRLPGNVAPVFEQRLKAALPKRAGKVMKRIRDLHGGALDSTTFGNRFVCEGSYWESVCQLFAIHADRVGLRLGDLDDDAEDRVLARPDVEEGPSPPDAALARRRVSGASSECPEEGYPLVVFRGDTTIDTHRRLAERHASPAGTTGTAATAYSPSRSGATLLFPEDAQTIGLPLPILSERDGTNGGASPMDDEIPPPDCAGQLSFDFGR